tara:strand:+ start:41171 stop:41593 length:423 start_codon:yes stop_codon:yes gene_type:complete
MTKTDNRNATRVALNVPILIESIGQPKIELHPALANVYSRVHPEPSGDKFPGLLRDLSTNGAFVSGDAIPLLSRIAFSFELEDFGRVEGIGWTMWRREDDCEIPREGLDPARLPKGFGILFEAIPLDARLAIHRMVQRKS